MLRHWTLLFQILQQQLYEKTSRDAETFTNSSWAIWPKVGIQVKSDLHSLAVQPPALSFTHTILTVGFDPGNVIQMSCIVGATALTEEVEKTPIVWRRGLQEQSTDGGSENKCLQWELFLIALANSSSKLLCRTLCPRKGIKSCVML